jgi:superfamily II DNA or RNA helicase
VQVAQQRGQREGDDRGVREGEAGAEGEQDGRAPHGSIVPSARAHTLARPSMTTVAAPVLPAWPATRPLRAWQRAALDALAAREGESFLASATPAAGKTTFGLRVAHDMLRAGRVARVVVLGPTAHICRQWAADAARYGIDLEPNRPNAEGPEPRDRHGVAVTYQAVAAGPRTHARAARRATLVIADEPHHMGEHAAWGVKARDAFDAAEFRLLLSGTPFRSDNAAIPWVAYDAGGISRADYVYGYPEALVDGVCRPITFLPYDGEMEWVSEAKLRRATFEVALPHAETARRLRTALDAHGDWMGQVLRDADARLAQVRAAGHPDAGGLVVAADKEHAGAVAARLEGLAGERPEIVTSDEPDASARIAAFAAGTRRWLVSVLMVSEGVDIPRLRVGVYATPARTELFFRQVVGRFVRRTPAPREQMSYLLLPADARLKELATRVEEERKHALTLEPGEPLEEAEPVERRAADEPSFTALSSSAFADDAILTETMQLFATEPAPSPALQAFSAPHTPAAAQPEATFASRERLREERAALVARVARRTGEEHRTIHARINRATGASTVGSATREQLERGNALLGRELAR